MKTTWARRVCSHHALCGISHAHLARLVNELAAPWTARHEAALEQRRGRARQRATGAGPNHHLVFADRLLVTLVVLRFQLPHRVLAVMFGVDRSTVTRAVHEVRPLLAQRGFAVPDRPGILLKTLADVFAYAAADGVTLRIDGTEVQVRRPRANRAGRKAFVSGKKKQNTIKPTVVGDGDGRMLWAGATRPGRMHDATAVRTEGIEDLLRCHPQVNAEVDSGYQGLARERWGARHARRMYNATTSTNASHADPQGRLRCPRPPAAAPPPPRSRAGVQRPSQLPPSTLPAAGQPRAAGQRARCHSRRSPPVVGHGRHHPAAPPDDRRPHAAQQHRPAAHNEGGGAGLRLAAGIPCRPGDNPAMAKHQYRQRAWGAPGHRAGPARPAWAAPSAGDHPAPPGGPAADRVLGGQAAGPPGWPGVRRCGGLPADAAGRAGLVASAHARRASGRFRMAQGPDASARDPLTYGWRWRPACARAASYGFGSRDDGDRAAGDAISG